MKKIFRTFLSIVVFMLPVSSVFAQTEGEQGEEQEEVQEQVIPDEYHDKGGLTYSKIVQGPNSKGEYTIYLKTFVTGQVTAESGIAPADIVLVLDYSTSMKQTGTDGQTLLSHLQTAVTTFVQQIKSSNDNVVQDSKGGHRIAFVLYGASVRNSTGLNTFYNVENYTVGNTGSAVYYGSTNVLNWTNSNQGTASGTAMQKARDIIKTEVDGHTYEDKTIDGKEYKNSLRSKMVVWFTDGAPTGTNIGESTEGTNCIVAANTIKNEYGGFVYSIGLFTNMNNPKTTKNKQTTFLSYTSSDYSDNGDADHQTKTTYPSSNYVTCSWKYSFVTNDPTELGNIFSSISSETPSADIDLGTSTTVVDVVSKSFALPTGSNASDVKIYETEPTGFTLDENNNPVFTFSTSKADWDDITDDVELDAGETDPSTVSVEGWDFEENMCAVNPDGETWRGKQLILEIPIVMNPNAVGGHGVGTNGPGSGISYVDSNNNPGMIYFDTPDLNLPINLHIQKRNLNVGESARFTIQRMWNGSDADKPATIDDGVWYNYTTVFVTRRQESETGDNSPIVKIVGLHPDYIYRIKEEDWGWSYGVSSVYGKKYDPETESESTVTMNNGTEADWSDNTVTSDQININPFIFVNSKKDIDRTVRNAESLVRNEFKKATSTTDTKSGETTNSKTQP